MKTKLLFSACALTAVFAACNNEELVVENTPVQNANQKIIGADLVSEGMTLDFGASRATNSAWEDGDELALAWYNVGENIWSVQTEEAWKNMISSESKMIAQNEAEDTSSYIFGNDLFTRLGNQFVTNANIYQGAYFVYYPYIYHSQISQLKYNTGTRKTVNPINPAQTNEFENELMNKALHISAQDFIKAGEATADGKSLTKSFIMSPMVNALRVEAKPATEIVESELLSNYKIQSVQLSTGNSNVKLFKTGEVAIVPKNIPDVKYVNGDKKKGVDRTATIVALDNYAKTLGNADSYTLVTNVEADYTIGEQRDIRVFALPTAELKDGESVANANVRVNIYTPNDRNASWAYFSARNEVLAQTLKGEYTAKNYSLTEIVRTDKVEGGEWNFFNLPTTLDINTLTVNSTTINSEADWNSYIALVNEVAALKGDNWKQIPVITLGKDITFENGITAPNVNVQVKSNAGKKIYVKNESEWPATLKGVRTTDGNLEVKVLDGGVLTVKTDATADSSIDFGTAVGGVINLASKDAKIHVYNGNQNNQGQIKIGVYGAKIDATDKANVGNVAFEIKRGEKNLIYKINTLIATTGEHREFALVNQLIVGAGVNFDLSATEKTPSTTDEYLGTTNGETISLDSEALANVEILLQGGTITNGADAEDAAKVKNIVVEKGTANVISDVTDDALTVKTGAKATIKSTQEVKELTYGKIVVEKGATLTVIDGVKVSTQNLIMQELYKVKLSTNTNLTASK